MNEYCFDHIKANEAPAAGEIGLQSLFANLLVLLLSGA